MDLKDIEAWGRELLLHEARKRGLRTPEVYSRGELIRLILKHDGAPTNVREAARLLGGFWGQAKFAWRTRFGAQLGTGAGVGGVARGDAGRAGAGARSAQGEAPAARGAYDSDALRAAAAARSAQGEAPAARGAYDSDALRAAAAARSAQGEAAGGRGAYASDAARAADSGGSSRAQRESDEVQTERGASGKSDASAQGTAAARNAQGREESGRFTREESRAATRLDRSRTESRSGENDELAADAQRSDATKAGAPSAPQRSVDTDSSSATQRDLGPAAVQARSQSQSSTLQSPWSMPPEAPRLRLVESPNQSATEVAAPLASAAPTSVVATGTPYSMPLTAATPAGQTAAAAGTSSFAATATYPQAASTEQLSYGPHPTDGLLLRWRVTPEAIERARAVLGSAGELAVRIVAVRIEPHAVVKTEIIDHGPINDAGDWTAPLLPTEARYVSAIGVRTPDRFVSIVHAAS